MTGDEEQPRRTRRPNGESWISDKPNKEGLYEATVWIGRKPDGSPDRRHVQRKKLADVKKRVKELERKRDTKTAGKAGRLPTVEDMLIRHLTVVLPTKGRAPRTIDDYWSKCRNDIFPRWGGTRIDRLLPEYIEDGYAEMLAEGHAPSHVRKVHTILNSAYETVAKRSRAYGLEGGTVVVNPCQFVEQPDLKETEKKSLTLRQARAALRQAEKEGNWLRWAYGMGCGNRQGEALGLRWSYLEVDVPEGEPGAARIAWQLQRLTWEHGCADEEAREIRKQGLRPKQAEAAIAKAVHPCAARHCKAAPCPEGCKAHKRGCPSPCPPDCTGHARYCPRRKLPAGCVPLSGGLALREVKEGRRARVKVAPVPPELCGPLREHRARQFEQKMLAGPEWHENDLVFCRWNGDPVDPRHDWEDWRGILEAAGVQHVGTHGTRHTTATLAIDEGVAITVVKEMLGHSDIRITDGYVRTSSPMAQRAARKVGGALFGDE